MFRRAPAPQNSAEDEYITEGKVIPLFSNVKESMEEDEELCKCNDTIEAMLSINEENVDEVLEKIQENFKGFGFPIVFLEHALKIIPKQSDAILSLLEKISKLTEYTPSPNVVVEYYDVLLQKGLIKEEEGTGKIPHKNLYEDGSIEKAIKEDNVSELVKISAQHDFDPKQKIVIDKDQAPYFVTEDINEDDRRKRATKVSYMQLMAYFGSVKCFKYALMSEEFDESDLSRYAVANGNTEIIHLIEQQNPDEEGKFDNCFETSVKFHKHEISNWLLQNYKCKSLDLSETVEFFNIPAFYFLFKNDISSSEFSIKKAVFTAAKCGFVPIIKYLIGQEVDINSRNEEGKTLLHIACENNCIDVIDYLVGEGVDIDVLDNGGYRGEPPIYYVCKNGNFNTFKHIVEKYHPMLKDFKTGNAEIKAYLEKALLLNKACHKGDIDTVRRLVEEEHISVNQGFNGASPLHYAAAKGDAEIIDYLASNGADIYSKLDSRFGHREDATNGWEVLHVACYNDNLEAIQCLVEDYGADVNSQCGEWTPLRCVCCHNYKSIHYLIDKGVDLEQRDDLGYTFLHLACLNGNYKAAVELIRSGADTEAEDIGNHKPAWYCGAGWFTIENILSGDEEEEEDEYNFNYDFLYI